MWTMACRTHEPVALPCTASAVASIKKIINFFNKHVLNFFFEHKLSSITRHFGSPCTPLAKQSLLTSLFTVVSSNCYSTITPITSLITVLGPIVLLLWLSIVFQQLLQLLHWSQYAVSIVLLLRLSNCPTLHTALINRWTNIFFISLTNSRQTLFHDTEFNSIFARLAFFLINTIYVFSF